MRRSRLEIKFEILEHCRYNKLKWSHINQKSNLSFFVCKELLEELVENELLNETPLSTYRNSRIYTITDRGKKAISLFNSAKQMLTLSCAKIQG